jgi:hypothetical protein
MPKKEFEEMIKLSKEKFISKYYPVYCDDDDSISVTDFTNELYEL